MKNLPNLKFTFFEKIIYLLFTIVEGSFCSEVILFVTEVNAYQEHVYLSARVLAKSPVYVTMVRLQMQFRRNCHKIFVDILLSE